MTVKQIPASRKPHLLADLQRMSADKQLVKLRKLATAIPAVTGD